jgi:hypothetical protein
MVPRPIVGIRAPCASTTGIDFSSRNLRLDGKGGTECRARTPLPTHVDAEMPGRAPRRRLRRKASELNMFELSAESDREQDLRL